MPSRLRSLGLSCLLIVPVQASARLPAAHHLDARSRSFHFVHRVSQAGKQKQTITGLRRARSAKRTVREPAQASDQGVSLPACNGLSGRTIAIDTSKPVHIGWKSYPETLDLADHEVVLTFDDGPSPATTPAVLEALRHECVKATFFLIGRNAAASPSLVRRELAEGHTLGHHSMTHPSVTLRGLDDRSGEREIDEGIAADEKAAYGDTGAAPRMPFFRFPGFADTKHLMDHLDGRHIAVFGTDLWAADWLPMTPDFERRRVIGLLDRAPRHAGIILFHDTHTSTARMLPAFLRDLREKGYKVVDLVPSGTAGGDPAKLAEAPKGWSSETDAIIAHVWPRIEPGAHHRLVRKHANILRLATGQRSRLKRARTAAK